MVEDRADGDIASSQRGDPARFIAGGEQAARDRPRSTPAFAPTVPQYRVDLDTDKVQTLGIPVTDVYSTLQTFLGGLYVNDFNRFGRTWRVLMQAEPEFRAQPDDIDRFYVRTAGRRHGAAQHAGQRSTPVSGPDVIYRYNRYPRRADRRAPTRPATARARPRRRWRKWRARCCRPASATNGPARVFQQRRTEGTGADHLRLRRAAGVAVPRGALRELDHPVRGRAGRAARPVRRARRR